MESIYVELIQRRNFINCSDFEGKDLSTFVDSLETIARIQRERQERRLRRKQQKLNTSKIIVKADVHANRRSEDSSETEEDSHSNSKPICPKQLRCKLFESNAESSPVQSSDENYFSGASRSESPSEGSKDGIDVIPSTDSGTESESGVYQLRPRSFIMTNPKYRTTRARIIGLVLKREYADGGDGSQDSIEKQERRERVLESLLREKEKCESLRLPTKEARKPIPNIANKKSSTAEMRFIDKALRYLTL